MAAVQTTATRVNDEGSAKIAASSGKTQLNRLRGQLLIDIARNLILLHLSASAKVMRSLMGCTSFVPFMWPLLPATAATAANSQED